MTLEALYRRSLILVALLAFAVAGVTGYVAYAWGSTTPLFVTAASVALAGGAIVARRGRLYRPMLLLAMGSGLCAAAAFAMVPWWVAVPAGLGIVAFGLLVPSMFRRDRMAATLATLLSVAFGVQAAWAVDAAVDQPRATLDRFEVTPPAIPIDASTDVAMGRADARHDLAAGRWRLLTYGYPAGWVHLYGEALRRDGIELQAVAGCVVTTELVDHARGYNEVMEAAIAKMLGPSYLESRRRAAQDAMEFEVW